VQLDDFHSSSHDYGPYEGREYPRDLYPETRKTVSDYLDAGTDSVVGGSYSDD
jgi:hypothetical protein